MSIRNLKTLCMLGAGALATLGLASCGTAEKPKMEIKLVDPSPMEKKFEFEELKKQLQTDQTNPLEKQNGSYYV